MVVEVSVVENKEGSCPGIKQATTFATTTLYETKPATLWQQQIMNWSDLVSFYYTDSCTVVLFLFPQAIISFRILCLFIFWRHPYTYWFWVMVPLSQKRLYWRRRSALVSNMVLWSFWKYIQPLSIIKIKKNTIEKAVVGPFRLISEALIILSSLNY